MDGTTVERRARTLALLALLILVVLCAVGAVSFVLSGYSWV